MRWSWMYNALQARDLRIDFLRGYALFMMIVDHVGPEWLPNNGGGQSILYNLTGATMFYTSAAEIFYFVSGLTLGIVCATGSFERAIRRTLGRTWALYYTVILMSLFFAALYHLFAGKINLWSIYDLAKQNYGAFALQTLTLQVTGHAAEVLVLYVVFMMFAPLALWMLFMRRWYVVLIASGLMYLISQMFPEYQNTNFTVTSYFSSYAWQALFFGGLVIGFHRRDLAALWDRVPAMRNALEVAVLAAALAFLWVFIGKFEIWPELPALLGGFDDQGLARHEALTPMRLILSLLYIQAAYILISWLWTPLHRALGWLLEVLGRQSLWAFVTHMAVYVALHNLPAFNNHAGNFWWWQLLGVLAVWAFIRAYEPIARRVFGRGKPPPAPPGSEAVLVSQFRSSEPEVSVSASAQRIEPADALIFEGLAQRANEAFAWRQPGFHGLVPQMTPQMTGPTFTVQDATMNDASPSRRLSRASRWQPRGELIGAGPISRALEPEHHLHHRLEADRQPQTSQMPGVVSVQAVPETSGLTHTASHASRLEVVADTHSPATEDAPLPGHDVQTGQSEQLEPQTSPVGPPVDVSLPAAETESSSEPEPVATAEPDQMNSAQRSETPPEKTPASAPRKKKSSASGSGQKASKASSKPKTAAPKKRSKKA